MSKKIKAFLLSILLSVIFICACGTETKVIEESIIKETKEGQLNNDEVDPSMLLSEDFTPYEVPEMLLSAFHKEHAIMDEEERAFIDVSECSDGYVSVSAVSDVKMKVQVICNEETYNYDLKSDGTVSVFPLQMGDGIYEFRIMENVSDSKYAELHSVMAEIKIGNEFSPYLRPSDYVSYDENSEVVKAANAIAAKSQNQVEVISNVFSYVTSNISYDYEKAKDVETGYLPDPDEILNSKTGICFDYAAVTAAMLRSLGIPTKMVTGYVEPDNVYHAWNMFYTEESGWVKVEYKVNAKDWTRMDCTFSSGGAEDSFVTDDHNYTDVYTY